MAYIVGPRVYVRSLESWDAPPLILEHLTEVLGSVFDSSGERLVTVASDGKIRIWSLAEGVREPLRVLDVKNPRYNIGFSQSGRWLAAACDDSGGRRLVCLYDLTAPPNASPIVLMSDRMYLSDIDFDPREKWVVTSESDNATFWALGDHYPLVFEGHERRVDAVRFSPDGKTLLSASNDGTLRAWPLDAGGERARVLLRTPMAFPGIAVDREGAWVAVSAHPGRVFVVPLAGGPAKELEGFSQSTQIWGLDFSPDGRRVAAAPFIGKAEEKVVRVWDLESGEMRVLGPIPGAGEGFEGRIDGLAYQSDDTILASSDKGLLRFDLRSGDVEVLSPVRGRQMAVSPKRAVIFRIVDDGADATRLVRLDLNTGESTRFDEHGLARTLELDPTGGVIATSSFDGVIRVGAASGGEPHLLFGHKGLIRTLAFSPDGRWLASAGDDRFIRLWKVPDVTKPPPHKRSHDEFLAILKTWTNVRVVPDEASPTGWKLEVGPFPGWAELPRQ